MLLSSSIPYAIGILIGITYITYKLIAKFILKREVNILIDLILGSFIVYIFAIIGLTLFPLPIGAEHLTVLRGTQSDSSITFNILPFTSILDTIVTQEISSNTYQIVRQLGGNVLLFIPIGIYVPLLFKNKFKNVLIFGFILSLAIEIFQLIISMFIDFNYRITDIDDIILNTSGAILGFLISKYLGFQKIDDMISSNVKKVNLN
ncbi:MULTISPECIES: VanZ family protein [Robertmurraya]|uniref:VanZ family protein n=1 Tax=Robertmurraya beringensis TaxID=641660 RepID=A0ABV6KKR0_9BACI